MDFGCKLHATIHSYNMGSPRIPRTKENFGVIESACQNSAVRSIHDDGTTSQTHQVGINGDKILQPENLLCTPCIMISTKELHLSIVDQTTFRQYIRSLYIFPFPEISRADDAIHALRTSLSLALRHYPHLAGALEVPDRTTGYLEAIYPNPVRSNHGDIMLSASFALLTNPSFDYCIMEEEGFPPAMLPAYAFCPLGLQNRAGLEHPYGENGASAARGYPSRS
jgi:hypothetical protein